ncbi:MAG TPA: pilus assembly protein TadG-related protein [Ktedonobacterales bacterium]|nr:pilus assembly protein TadG-related protein [Ktedonobacterales bacterium]
MSSSEPLRRAFPPVRRRHPRRTRHRQRGQTLIIFALTFSTLLGLSGLAVDVARAYDLYGKMQRAAEAGALAAALYMPNNFSTTLQSSSGPAYSAITRAYAEVFKDGFGTGTPPNNVDFAATCPNVPTTVEIVVCPVTGKADDVRVTINETLNVMLISGLGVAPVRLSASAEAAYLSPIQIGTRSNTAGDSLECSPGNSLNSNTSACDPTSASNHLQGFLESLNGPAELKEQGDPMVYCEEGPSYLTNYPGIPAPYLDPNNGFDAYTSYNGISTDHPNYTSDQPITQYCGKPVPGAKAGNPDYQPDGYSGPATVNSAHPGGYNFEISVASDMAAASLWVYNANYVPQDNNGGNTLDYFLGGSSNYFEGPNGEGLGANGHASFDGSNLDAPLFYFDLTYTVYQVNSQYDRSSDVKVFSQVFHPYDGTSNDVWNHCGSFGTQLNPESGYQNIPQTVYDPYYAGATTQNAYNGAIQYGKGCVNPALSNDSSYPGGASPLCVLRWCKLSLNVGGTGGLQGGRLYRLVIEATGLTANGDNYTSTVTDGWGSHSFALKLCDTANPANPVNCGNDGNGLGAGQYKTVPNLAIFPWNNMDVVFQAALSSRQPNQNYPQTSCVQSNGIQYSCVDLACIPSDYAGRSVTVSLFDVGDGYQKQYGATGNIYISIVPPAGSVPKGTTIPISYAPTPTGMSTQDGDIAAVGSSFTRWYAPYRPFNGLWLTATIQLPSNYTGTCVGNSGWFQLAYMVSNSNLQPNDKVGVGFALVGSPVHLTPLTLG